MCRCSAIDRTPAPSETTARSARVSRSGLEQQLAADGEAEAADAIAVHLRAPAQEPDGGGDVGLALPAEGVVGAVALALAAPVEQQDAVSVTDEHARVGTGCDRPGKAITAAPLRDGTYHAASESPSQVWSVTRS